MIGAGYVIQCCANLREKENGGEGFDRMPGATFSLTPEVVNPDPTGYRGCNRSGLDLSQMFACGFFPPLQHRLKAPEALPATLVFP